MASKHDLAPMAAFMTSWHVRGWFGVDGIAAAESSPEPLHNPSGGKSSPRTFFSENVDTKSPPIIGAVS